MEEELKITSGRCSETVRWYLKEGTLFLWDDEDKGLFRSFCNSTWSSGRFPDLYLHYIRLYGDSLPTDEKVKEVVMGVDIRDGKVVGKCGVNLWWSLVNGILRIRGTGEMYEFATMGGPWYKFASEIVEVRIKDGCTGIGFHAFAGCRNVKKVEIPPSVEYIEFGAFRSCSALTTINIPDDIKYICDYSFCWCDSLETIKLPDSIKGISRYAFYRCTSLTDIYIPRNVEYIDWHVFGECTSLQNIYVASDNEHLMSANGIVYDKTMRRLICHPAGRGSTIKVAEGITEIEGNAFSQAPGITDVWLPRSLRKIGPGAFAECTGLRKVRIPDEVEIIEGCAFKSCNNLESFVFPKNTKLIGMRVFAECKNLKFVIIPEKTITIYRLECYDESVKEIDTVKHRVELAKYLGLDDESLLVVAKQDVPISFLKNR